MSSIPGPSAEQEVEHLAKQCATLLQEIERRRAWAEDEQSKRHRAEEDRMNARSEVERLRTQCGGNCRYWEGRWRDEKADNDRLRIALQALRDHNVEYARINNLFNGDGTPATFHELLQARAALEPKPVTSWSFECWAKCGCTCGRAEIERLTAENKRQLDSMRDGINALDELRAEIERLKAEKNRPWLGLATTRELLDELRTRIEMHSLGGLDYRTVDGEKFAEKAGEARAALEPRP